MSISLRETFDRGGRELVDLLEFLVIAYRMDPLFLFLAGEYRMLPSAAGAVALFDVFCTPGSPAVISARTSIPPYDQRIRTAVERYRVPTGGAPAQGNQGLQPLLLPPKYLFDPVSETLEAEVGALLLQIEREYDAAKTPHENLPGGRMTAVQRAFVENHWQPRIRPYLVSSGFRRIANIA